jgi:altronate dehydratase
MSPQAPKVLRLDPRDNVAVALAPLVSGDPLHAYGLEIVVRQPIPFQHKVALTTIALGAPVMKYGETIGVASAAIEPGEHVHVHNVASSRFPGRA